MSSSPFYDFDTPVDRRGTGSEKWDKYRGKDVLPLWVADMDFTSPPEIIRALRQRVEHGVFGYGAPPAELAPAIRDYLAAEYGWEVAPDGLVWLPGLASGLHLACRAAGNEGDGVIVCPPIYPPFLAAPRRAGRALISVPLRQRDGRWEHDLAALEQAVTLRSRLLMLCHPHNPVGRVYGREELTAVADFARQHDLIVCSDEIHCDLILDADKRHVPFAALGADAAQRSITLMAPSKTFNLPGLGFSFAVIPNAELRQRFRAVMAGIVPPVNIFGFVAAKAAYREGAAWRRALLDYLRQNRAAVTAAVAALPGLAMVPPQATYLAWIDARGLGLADPARFFEEAGVGLSDGKDFGAAGYVRLNFGCPRSTLEEALRRIAQAIGGRRGR